MANNTKNTTRDQLLTDLREQFEHAEFTRQKTATVFALVLINAPVLMGISGDEFCDATHLPVGFAIEFNKLINQYITLQEMGYNIVQNNDVRFNSLESRVAVLERDAVWLKN